MIKRRWFRKVAGYENEYVRFDTTEDVPHGEIINPSFPQIPSSPLRIGDKLVNVEGIDALIIEGREVMEPQYFRFFFGVTVREDGTTEGWPPENWTLN